jgi:AraC-like DNA-binding protein
MPKHKLTALLNDHIGKNFFTFVNEFRLDEVIVKLKSPDFDHRTIMSIAYDSGFNSKSTFNSLFKKHTGHTPSQFKKNLEKGD